MIFDIFMGAVFFWSLDPIATSGANMSFPSIIFLPPHCCKSSKTPLGKRSELHSMATIIASFQRHTNKISRNGPNFEFLLIVNLNHLDPFRNRIDEVHNCSIQGNVDIFVIILGRLMFYLIHLWENRINLDFRR